MRVIVSGYYGSGNAGDEAMLAGVIAGMREAAGEVDFVVISRRPGLTARTHGVRSIGRTDVRSLRRELRASSLLISGGGSLFQDVTSARSCLYYLWIVHQALRAGVPVVAIGQGIGPLRRRWLRALVRRCLNRVQGIAVRDSGSARELQRLGVARAPVRVAADLSLAMPPADPQRVAEAWRDLGIGVPASVLAVAPRTWRVRGQADGSLPKLATAIRQAAASLGQPWQVVCFPMQRPQDDAACAALAAAVDGLVAGKELTPPMLAAMAGQTRAVVAMRLHALIFAATGGAMPVAVSYDPKVQALMTDLGLPTVATTDRFDEARLAAAIVEAWNADDAARAKLRRVMEERRDAVREVFRWAAETARRS